MTHPFDWQLLKSEYIVQDRWLSLRADTCQLPNGRIVAPYYILEYPTWVNVVALTKNHHVVLVGRPPWGAADGGGAAFQGTVEATDASR